MNELKKYIGHIAVPETFSDSIEEWKNLYFKLEVTTSESTQKIQEYDIDLLNDFLKDKITDQLPRLNWTPRASRRFIDYMKKTVNEKKGGRRWGDRSINRTIAHLKTFSRWIDRYAKFPLGDPMSKIQRIKMKVGEEVDRALKSTERDNILDAADKLKESGDLKDRTRYKMLKKRPKRKGYRPLRNKAIIYTLVETGMRRQGISNIDITNIDFDNKRILVEEKGGIQNLYQISEDGINAIIEYIREEREQDFEKWRINKLFLTANTISQGSGQISVRTINNIWNEVCKMAGVSGKTPHSTRHGMGKYLIKETGNIAAVQKQLNHRNPKYSILYTQASSEEIEESLEKRNRE